MKSVRILLLLLAISCLNNNSFIAQSADEFLRAVHAGGNWGENKDRGVSEQPDDYYDFLSKLSVNWVGISVALHAENSMDSTVECDTTETLVVPSFTKKKLKKMIQGFKSRGMKVLISLAIETQEASQSDKPFQRWQLGDTFIQNNDPNILPENWPWNPGHADHSTFVNEFWSTYAQQAAYIAQIAEEEEVDLFAIGAETDRLFRTRTSGMFPNEFKNNIQAVVDSVKNNFSGQVTYEEHWNSLVDTGTFGESVDYIWEDVGLDVIGISAYFQLADAEPNAVLSKETLTQKWQNIFTDYLIPLQNRHPDKNIYFLEFGYVDVVNSVFNAATDEFTPFVLIDNNNNSVDDGYEQQYNIISSFFEVNESHNNIIKAVFLWDFQIASDINWANGFGQMRTFAIRNKPAEEFVAAFYSSFLPLPPAPELLSPENNANEVGIEFVRLEWNSVDGALHYNLQLSDTSDFSTIVFEADSISMTSIFVPENLVEATDYYWRVKAVNQAGESEWSETFKFTTVYPVQIESPLKLPNKITLYQNYPNPFNPGTFIRYSVPGNIFLTIKIFDVLGNEITTLFEGRSNIGINELWWNAEDYTSGVYFCLLYTKRNILVQKIALIK